jgi:hypothetical protein
MKVFLTAIAIVFYANVACAQVDTLHYDGIKSFTSHALYAVTQFPGEENVVFNTRFTPTERCKITHIVLGMSVVKFDFGSGNDTLVVTLYDDPSLPLKNIIKTWRFNLGDDGFPIPNKTTGNPFNQGWRDLMILPLTPMPVIAPARDFIFGVQIKTKQKYVENQATFEGLAFIFNETSPNYERYRRFQNLSDGKSYNPPIGPSSRYSIYMRAVVDYDATLPDTDVVGVDEIPITNDAALAQNYPNPFVGSTSIRYTLAEAADVSLTVHDMMGREVALVTEGRFAKGQHQVGFRAADYHLPSGMYVYRLRNGANVITRTMILMQ